MSLETLDRRRACMARSIKRAHDLGPSRMELDVGKLAFTGREALGLTHRERQRTRYKTCSRAELRVLAELLRERIEKLPPCLVSGSLLRKVEELLT